VLELIAPTGRSLYPVGAGSLLRAPEARFRTGDVVEVPGMRATLVDVGDAGPRDVVFTFDRDISQIAWIQERYFEWPDAPLPFIGFGAPYDP
jgi:hypothetical protein